MTLTTSQCGRRNPRTASGLSGRDRRTSRISPAFAWGANTFPAHEKAKSLRQERIGQCSAYLRISLPHRGGNPANNDTRQKAVA